MCEYIRAKDESKRERERPICRFFYANFFSEITFFYLRAFARRVRMQSTFHGDNLIKVNLKTYNRMAERKERKKEKRERERERGGREREWERRKIDFM